MKLNIKLSRPANNVAASLLLLCLAHTPDLSAQDDTTLRLTLHPAGQPEPPLKYRLLPEFRTIIPGNATVWYGKVFAEQRAILENREFWGNFDHYMGLPLDQLRRNDMRWIASNKLVYDRLEKAARAASCDWQLGVRDESYYSILLPEIQETRNFARLLAFRVRCRVAEGDIDGAIRTLQSGFALARNVACGETVVSSLVAAAIHQMMTQVTIELVQQPGAPNLYWALTSLPDVDFRNGVEAGLAALALSFPVVANARSDEFGESYWNDQLRSFWKVAERKNHNRAVVMEPIELLVMRTYPLAKKRLTEEGFSQLAVNAMPVARVVLLQSFIEYERQLQNRFRWAHFPYPEAIERLGDEQQTEADASEILPWPLVFGTKVGSILKTKARTQLYVELLRTIEAIRLHAASHDGKLPKTLVEISVVPVPNDPMTGHPFPYQLTGDTAVIAPAAMDWKPNCFEITIAKKDDVQ